MDASQKNVADATSNPPSPLPKNKIRNLLKMQHKLPTIYEETLPIVKPKELCIDLDLSKLSLYNYPTQETVKEANMTPESISDLDVFVSDDEIDDLLKNTFDPKDKSRLFLSKYAPSIPIPTITDDPPCPCPCLASDKDSKLLFCKCSSADVILQK